ncbi:MAG TPA: CAP domain-containing protein, partial [Thermoanaerobaculia bacterium]
MRPLVSAILGVLIVLPALAQQPNYGGSVNGFPSWEERVVAQLTNRARVDPAADLANCQSGNCLESACYAARAPLFWSYDLNQSARFHSASMARFPFFAHDTPCQLFSDLDARYPGTSDGSFASSCSASGTTTTQARVNLFGAGYGGENIAAGQTTPHTAFYGWLHEPTSTSACGFTTQNGHRYNILTAGPGLGVGYAQVAGSPWTRYWTQDFGGSGSIPKIPSGTHWTAAQRRDPTASDSNV